MELQGQVEELRERGFGLAVISYDSQEIMAAFAGQRGITYPLLSDFGSATIRRYDILNSVSEWAVGPDSDDPLVQADVAKYVSERGGRADMIGMAFPGTFMLDPDGRVRSRFFEDFYIERNTVSSILMRLGEGVPPVTATKVSTPQLDLTTFASDAEVAMGSRFSLAFDIEPHAGMHVYAPGAADYRVIQVTIDPQPYVELLPMEYPDSEIYYFEPLDERVPIYQEPFTLVQEVLLEGGREARSAFGERESLRLTGTLEYQACDDSICYTPESVPLSWTMTLRPIIRERPSLPQ